jgi:hypothetical protein
MQSSSSYFGGTELPTSSSSSPSRKPPVPGGRIGAGKKAIDNNNNKGADGRGETAAPEDLFYAWDVVGADTACQSQKTEIIPGRTHAYSLDKVYDAAFSTKQVYEQSVKPLVTAAMEGTKEECYWHILISTKCNVTCPSHIIILARLSTSFNYL